VAKVIALEKEMLSIEEKKKGHKRRDMLRVERA
jgi:hypothetical protein